MPKRRGKAVKDLYYVIRGGGRSWVMIALDYENGHGRG